MKDESKDIKHMRSKIIVTADNSKTLLIPELNETYHSTKGAITEAQHVFIKEGLDQINRTEVRVFEMGFGTGLNALITLDEAMTYGKTVWYECIEAFPVSLENAAEMGYLNELNLPHLKSHFIEMHNSPDREAIQLDNNFTFVKILDKIELTEFNECHFDLIYYDAFGPKVQSELWGVPVLQKMFDILKPGGFLVTYCAQGQFKRNLKEIGFRVESLPGPPGKREMTRAYKE